MKKTITLFMLIAIMVVFVACGGNNGGNNNTGGAPANNGSSNTNTGADNNAEDDVLSGPKPTLRQLQPFDRFDPNEDYTSKVLEEETGYKSTFDQLPEESPNEKLNLLMANQEKYDIMRLSKDQFFRLAEAGALEPLNDLLEKYGQNILAGVSDETWAAGTVDGKIYSIPQAGTGTAASQSLVIRKDLLEETGLGIPTNRDELYNLLKAIKEKHPNMIPLVGNGSIFNDIARTFGIANSWKEVDGKLIHQAQDPRLPEYLAFMNKLYTEGLIDSEWPINTGSKSIEKFTSGKAAIMSMAWWSAPSVVNALESTFPGVGYVTIPFLQDDSGNTVVGVNTGITYFIAIPKWAPNKEHAMNYMNMKMDETLFKKLVIGEEGVHHTVEDGKYYPILPKFNDDLNNGSFFLTGVDERVYSDYWQARVRKDPLLQNYYEELQGLAEGKFVVDPMSNAAPITSIAENTQKLAQFSEDTFLKYIAGAEALSNFDSYLSQWLADGGEQMVNDANEWFASQQ